MTPHRFLELFFDEVLVGMIFDCTNLYSHREKASISFEINNKRLRLFLSMLLSGCHELPDCEIYWEATPDAFA